MKRMTALLAGATGLVGGECLRRLVACDDYARVIVVTRRDLGAAARNDKVLQLVTDLDGLASVRDQLRAEHVFCALGTTIRKAGSQDNFRRVDYQYPLQLAQFTRAVGARHFSVVSALGADARSGVFYSRVKGELEAALRAMDWPSLCIVRPSVIAGDRAESRPMERLAEHALRFAPAKWRSVAATDIAAAMVNTALRSPPGVSTIESRDIPAAARSASR
jgi:uncharacterized protein YbjT (DUF2867 family)